MVSVGQNNVDEDMKHVFVRITPMMEYTQGNQEVK